MPGSSIDSVIAFINIDLGIFNVSPRSDKDFLVRIGISSIKSWWIFDFKSFKTFFCKRDNSKNHPGPASLCNRLSFLRAASYEMYVILISKNA